jgi:hypothetical protein
VLKKKREWSYWNGLSSFCVCVGACEISFSSTSLSFSIDKCLELVFGMAEHVKWVRTGYDGGGAWGVWDSCDNSLLDGTV